MGLNIIEKKPAIRTTAFGEMATGTLFRSEGSIWMKIGELYEKETENAVDLADGITGTFDLATYYETVDADLVVKG